MDIRKRNASDSRRRIQTLSVISHGDMESTIHLLNYELYVASIAKDSLCSATHSLLQILLRLFGEDQRCRRNHFFNFTETSKEYSVIVDKELLEVLNPTENSKIEVTKTKWRPLVVEVGALGTLAGISNIVASVLAPLANCDVSVFCLSTNLDDFVLVKQGDLDKALACLSRSFKLVCDSDSKVDIALVQSVTEKAICFDSPKRKLSSIIPACGMCPSRPIVHPYVCASNQYSICGIVPRALTSIGTSLLELMLFNHRTSTEEGFLSFSIVEDDISIVLDCRDISRFPEDSLYMNMETWRMITIGEQPLGFDECGIVAQVSAPLAQAEISTYYICTFSTDHTLVPEESVAKGLRLLNDRYVSRLAKKMAKNGLGCNGQSPLIDSYASSSTLQEIAN